jgi:hypothetical protein
MYERCVGGIYVWLFARGDDELEKNERCTFASCV